MSMRLIYGRAGTGKSEYILNEVKQKLKSGQKIYIIVPEQFSYATEKRLLDTLSVNSVINAEVITFKRMANRIFTEVGGLTKTNLSNVGKTMLIHNILEKNKNKLQFLNKSKENVELVDRTITELKKHNIQINDLEQKTKQIQNEYLKIKVNDIKQIYEEYQNTISKNYIDEDDVLTVLAKKLEESQMFENSYIYIDEFSGFTKQEYLIIEELLKQAIQVNITICCDDINLNTDIDTDIFYTNKQVVKKLINCAKETNQIIEEPVELKEAYRFKNEELKHIEKNIYKVPYRKYTDKIENIHINLAANPYSEIESVAKKIINIVRQEGIRYKDISIISKNIDDYSSIVKAIFEKYEIPIFIDKKEDLSTNILIKYILSILEIFSKNWSDEAMFSYIKTGFLNIEKQDIYLLENYCKKWGIKGSKWYSKDWEYDALNKDLEKLNNLRKIIVEPLLKLKNELDASKTAEQITVKLYEFIEQNQIKAKLQEKIEKLQEDKIYIANQYNTSWNAVMQIFDEIVLIFKQTKMNFNQYKNILKVGLEFSKLGDIPQVIDQVILGDVERSRNHKVKVVFIIGLNDGIFPSANLSEGFLNDSDREQLKQIGLELAKGTLENIYEDEFNIYKAFTTAEEQIYLSYISADKEGKAKRPSMLISKIKKIFTLVNEESDMIQNKFNISTPNATFNEMIANIRKFKSGEDIDNRWVGIYNWYLKNEKWKQKLLNSIKGFEYKNLAESINKKNVQRLYGNVLKTSVSRLEQYKRCPFSFHLKYGLKLKEKEELKIKSIDTGSFMHDIIDTFFNKVENVKEIEEKEIEKIVKETINEKLNLNKNYIFNSTPKFIVLTNRLTKVVLQSIKYIVYQIQNSNFEIMGNEIEFKRRIENVEITGKIDRIDMAESKDGKYIRVIDYKSSNKNIDLNELSSGTQIQLLTYLDTAVSKENCLPAGMLYFSLIDNVIKSDKNLTDEEIKQELTKQFRMNGIILADINIVKMMDNRLQKGSSNIIPAYIDKDGNLSSSKSNLITKEQFTKLQDVVRKIIKQIGQEILEGNIEIKPTYNKKNKIEACKYCEYKSICGFNPSIHNYAFIENKSKEEILDTL